MTHHGPGTAVSITALILVSLQFVGSSVGSFAGTSVRVESTPQVAATQPAELPGLHNVVAYAKDLCSGSAPEGAAGFDTLADMGIKTVISVDGARPEVDLAMARGIRYVHLPIGYNGMDEHRTLEIARAVRDLPGPVYIHCHHGKHRSAAAAGAVEVTLGKLTNEQATARMKISGTAPEYPGLYACVAVATLAGEKLNAASDSFPSVWPTSGLVDAMVAIDEAADHLKAIEKVGWKTPLGQPDLVPASEAARLSDLLRNLRDEEHVKTKPPEFLRWLEQSSQRAALVEEGLINGHLVQNELGERFKSLTQSCADCHTKYRNK